MSWFWRRWYALYIWLAERLYHELAWAYDGVSWIVSLGAWGRWRRQALAHVTGTRVLELGFGTGALLLEMTRRDWQVMGLDPSWAMQRVTARRLRRYDVTLPRIQGRAQALPFTDDALDAVLATFPTGYVMAPATLREVARVLRAPGGRLIITGVDAETDRPWLRPLLRLIWGRPGAWVRQELEQRAAPYGLTLTVYPGAPGVVNVPVFVLEKEAD
jgi:ubiquinone/menaquinone biosynthesis C-methylase UbiE